MRIVGRRAAYRGTRPHSPGVITNARELGATHFAISPKPRGPRKLPLPLRCSYAVLRRGRTFGLCPRAFKACQRSHFACSVSQISAPPSLSAPRSIGRPGGREKPIAILGERARRSAIDNSSEHRRSNESGVWHGREPTRGVAGATGPGHQTGRGVAGARPQLVNSVGSGARAGPTDDAVTSTRHIATDRYLSSIQHRSGARTRAQSISPPGKIPTHSPLRVIMAE
jgi:hypothetical protein